MESKTETTEGDEKTIIELSDVSKRFGPEVVLRGLNLTIRSGTITVVVGMSGSGKSVLVKVINGLIPPDEGEVRLFGERLQGVGVQELNVLRQRVGTLFQDYALFDSMSVLDNVTFPLVENQLTSTEEAETRAIELLEELGLGHVIHQLPSSLSGGMKKRVSLARAMVCKPELVLFDEPTTGLDPVMTEVVDDMILEITRSRGLTALIVSHDPASIFRLADDVVLLEGGTIVYHGPPEEAKKQDGAKTSQLLRGRTRTDIQAIAPREAPSERGAELAVRLRAVSKSFSGRTVLNGADLEVPEGEITVVIGGSGAGKSVMMKHILGLMQPDSGAVELFGREIGSMDDAELNEIRSSIGMLFQHSALFDSMTVLENVVFPLVERRVSGLSEAEKKARNVLQQLGLEETADTLPSELSSGQQKRVALARAVVTGPKLIVYDEPTTGQDPIMAAYVEEMIVEAQKSFGLTSIVISHDMASTFRIADHVAMLHEGEIIMQGPPASFLQSVDPRVRTFVFAADPERASQGGTPSSLDNSEEKGVIGGSDSGSDTSV